MSYTHNIPQEQSLSPVKQALLALKSMKAKLAEAEAAQKEPIAIIGMSCRFPGGSETPAKYWQMLMSGHDAIVTRPEGRWLDTDAQTYLASMDDKQIQALGYGGYLDRLDLFEPAFFGMSARECRSVDPQQRLLLELSYEALENAGLATDRLKGEKVGSFVGIGNNDYGLGMLGTRLDPYIGTGVSITAGSGRINHTFGFTGPAISLDTACSSSLVTIHLAIQSLRTRESDIALAGGVNLIMTPVSSVNMTLLHALAPDGRCKTFAAEADGYGRSEGGGLVVLKRLSDAQADGDQIMAIVSGSAINHDGRSSGLTVPSQRAQEAVIRQALANADLEPGSIGYIEAHGTGTPLGDPIEINALNNVFGKERQNPLLLGSVKTNVGHLEIAAGIAGIIKLILALQHKQLPPHLHMDNPNPLIGWDQIPLRVTRQATLWVDEERPFIAGISGFGFTGTNAHLIISEAPSAQVQSAEESYELLTLSARNELGLKDLAGRYVEFLDSHPDASLADITYTASVGRSKLPHRLAIQVATLRDLKEELQTVVNGTHSSTGRINRHHTGQTPKLAFLFTGQGSQYVGMGQELYQSNSLFREQIDKCNLLLADHLDRSLISILFAPEDDDTLPKRIDQTEYTQPALFCLEYALARLWLSWGLEPNYLMGHSVGELVAACVAGVFSLEDGLKLIAARGRLMGALPTGGAMAAILTNIDSVLQVLAPYAGSVAIAAHNGPANVVISGDSAVVNMVCQEFRALGVRVVPLTVSHAFHSDLMKPMLAAFRQAAQSITYNQPQYWLISNQTGEPVGAEVASADYWVEHILATVQFESGIASLVAAGCSLFLEIGPKPTLISMARRCPVPESAVWLTSLHDKRSAADQLTRTLSALFVHGVKMNWAKIPAQPRNKIALPTYPFQRQSYWFKDSTTFELPGQQNTHFLTAAGHPLLGHRRLSPSATTTYDATWQEGSLPLSEDQSSVQMLLLETAMAAAGQHSARVLNHIQFPDKMIVEPASSVQLQTLLSPHENGGQIQLFSYEPATEQWTLHLQAATDKSDRQEGAGPTFSIVRTQCAETRQLPGTAETIYCDQGQFLMPIRNEASGIRKQLHFSPTTLKTCLTIVHQLSPFAADPSRMTLDSIRSAYLQPSATAAAWMYGKFAADEEQLSLSLFFFDQDGEIIAELIEINWLLDMTPQVESWLHEVVWELEELPCQADTDISSAWLVVENKPLLAPLMTEISPSLISCAIPSDVADQVAAHDITALCLDEPEDVRDWVHKFASQLAEGQLLKMMYGWQFSPADNPDEALIGLLYLVQALRDLPVAEFWLCTGGVATISGRDVIPAAGALWGLAGTIAAEFSNWRTKRLDLEATISAERLGSLLGQGKLPPLLAIHQNRPYSAHLAALTLPDQQRCQVVASKTYLITGGLGSLGTAFTQWLIDQGAQNIALCSRHTPSTRQQEKIKSWLDSGKNVRHFLADVALPAQISELFAELDREMPPLAGLLHAAGTEDNDLLIAQDKSRFRAVTAAKISGSWLLHQATKDRGLDFFVCFSSAAAILGTPGLSSYAAANAYQDSLCHYRQPTGFACSEHQLGSMGRRRNGRKSGCRLVARDAGGHYSKDCRFAALCTYTWQRSCPGQRHHISCGTHP